jgi:hypothetical protein
MKYSAFVTLLIISGLISSCYSQEDFKASESQLGFDFRLLVEEGLQNTFSAGFQLEKSLSVTDADWESILLKSAEDAEADLKFLIQYDVNKPAYMGQFDIKRGTDSFDQEYIRLRAINPGKTPIRFFEYRSKAGNPVDARWEVVNKNMIINNLRYYSIEFDQHAGKTTLKGYTLDLGQKIVGRDSTYYKLIVRLAN